MFLGNLIMTCRQSCFSAWLKNRGFRAMKFKSNGTKAKRPLKQIQKIEWGMRNQTGIEKKMIT